MLRILAPVGMVRGRKKGNVPKEVCWSEEGLPAQVFKEKRVLRMQCHETVGGED